MRGITSQFQFHTGTIKSAISSLVYMPTFKFQFHTGTIKRKGRGSRSGDYRYFNSTLVRLRDCKFAETCRKTTLFQFHTGTIKRDTASVLTALATIFQFHTGTIKSLCTYV